MLLFSWYHKNNGKKAASRLNMWPEAKVRDSYLNTVKPISISIPQAKQAETELNTSPPSKA